MNIARSVQIIFISFALLVHGRAVAAPLLTQQDVKKLWDTFQASTPETDSLNLSVQVSYSLKVIGNFSITSKGNGVLQVPGVNIRLYDGHDDGVVFDSFLLNNELVDVDGDGFKDIVLWGTSILYDDKDDKEIGRRPVLSIFRFDPKTKKFINTVPSQDVYVY